MQYAFLFRFLVRFEGLNISVNDVEFHWPFVMANESLVYHVALFAFI